MFCQEVNLVAVSTACLAFKEPFTVPWEDSKGRVGIVVPQTLGFHLRVIPETQTLHQKREWKKPFSLT
jgi:hypothetical protein